MKKYLIALLLVVNMAIPVFASALADIDPNPDASSCVTIINNLRYRDRDANRNGEVSLLQDFLQSKGYLNSEPTGYFGLLTLRAVKSFQNANGITPASGYVGPITRTKIREITCDPSMLQASLPQSVTNNTPTTATCSASSTPSIKVLAPNSGDEVYEVGERILVKWESCNIPATTLLAVNFSGGGNVFGFLAPNGTPNDGIETFATTNWTPGSDYKITVGVPRNGDLSNSALTVYDVSDKTFTINRPINNLPAGCSSATGYSATTGQSCGCVGTVYSTYSGQLCPGNATLTIIEDSVPNNAQDFSFLVRGISSEP